jgi:glycosyltransferase involved in cell wall biosynthesis
MSPRLSVIICSLNGADGVDRCLTALTAQSTSAAIEVIVVDDGSADSTSAVGRAHSAIVVRHESCRGLSAARNSGIRRATAPLVAFLDDDCEPEPDWAEKILSGFSNDLVALGGALITPAAPGIMLGFLRRHNPLDPQELDLARSNNLAYRLWLYIRRQWTVPGRAARRPVFAFAGGNMSVRRSALLTVGGFDEGIRFGGDDDDLFLRLERSFPGRPLMYDPDIRVIHHFVPSLRDTLRRARAYGRGRAWMYRKWPDMGPALFPFPVMMASLLVASFEFPYLAAAVVLLPQLLYPAGLRAAVSERRLTCLLDPYIQLGQEACGNWGFLQGCWRFRGLVPEFRGLGTNRPDKCPIGWDDRHSVGT